MGLCWMRETGKNRLLVVWVGPPSLFLTDEDLEVGTAPAFSSNQPGRYKGVLTTCYTGRLLRRALFSPNAGVCGVPVPLQIPGRQASWYRSREGEREGSAGVHDTSRLYGPDAKKKPTPHLLFTAVLGRIQIHQPHFLLPNAVSVWTHLAVASLPRQSFCCPGVSMVCALKCEGQDSSCTAKSAGVINSVGGGQAGVSQT